MGLGSRLMSLVKGKANRAVENAEKSDPDAIYRAAVDNKIKEITELRVVAREVKGFEIKEDEEIADCNLRLDALKMDLDAAMSLEDAELGAELIGEIEEVEAEIEVNLAEKEEYAERAQAVINALDIAKKDLSILKKEQAEAGQMEKTHKVMSSIQDRLDGVGSDDTSIALENARARTRGIKADQQAMASTKAATMDSKRAALREKAAAGKNVDKFKEMMAAKKGS